MISSDTSPSDLAYLLGTSLAKLSYVIYGIKVEKLYHKFEVPKKNGGVRIINAPDPQLKILQARLKNILESIYRPHPAATAFIRERGIVFNARKHVKKQVVFNIDLKDFYHQINFGRVRGLLISPPYSLKKETATLIAGLCCTDNVLPQGAPTSPIVSNMICRRLDRELSLLAKNNYFYYTRYADDITFSSHTNSDNNIYCSSSLPKPSVYLAEIIESNGFLINESKTRLQDFKHRQVVTGLKVNKIINIDRRYYRKTKAMLHSLSHDIESANDVHQLKSGVSSPHLKYVVYGRINYIAMVKGFDSSVFLSLAHKFNLLDLPFKVRTSPKKKSFTHADQLNFYSYSKRKQLERCVWVVGFDGIGGLSLDESLVQASAFMCKGQNLITASHVFSKAGNISECFVYRIYEQNKKYKAAVIKKCNSSDIAELKIIGDDIPVFQELLLAPDLNISQGYQLSLIGFPELLPGHDSLSITPCTVINTFTKSSFKHVEIDIDIRGGNSGGPVVNAYMQVVGMALTGRGVTFDHNSSQSHFEGINGFISAKHFSFF